MSLRRLNALCLGFALLCPLVTPLFADSPPPSTDPSVALSARLDSLEKDLTRLRQQLAADGSSGSLPVRPAGREPWLSLGGLLQAQGEFGTKGDSRYTNANDRFYLRRAQLFTVGHFLEDFDFKLCLELSGTLATSTAALSPSGLDEYITWTGFGPVHVRAGQFKAPYGYEWLLVGPAMATPERSLGSDKLVLNRQLGVMAFSDLFDKRASYAVAMVNGNGRNVATNDNNDFCYVGRVTVLPWRRGANRASLGVGFGSSHDSALTPGVEFKFSTSTAGTTNSFTGRRWLAGADFDVVAGPLEVWGEYLEVRWDSDNLGTYVLPEVPSQSYTGACVFDLVPKAVQVVARYNAFKANAALYASPVESWTLGVNWLIKGNDLKLMLSDTITNDPAQAYAQDKVISRLQTIF